MKKVKITVLKKEFYEDIADAFLTEGHAVGSCSLLEEGDVFIFEGRAEMPEGFCPWAWMDIYSSVSAIAAGATYTPWNNKDGLTILCCTDGVRPVIFSVEGIDDSAQ